MPIEHLVFDLDETLYPAGLTFWREIGKRIRDFLAENLGLSAEAAELQRREYYQTYGTTLRGLLEHHPEIDLIGYMTYVHNVDVSKHLTPNPALDAMLATLPVPKSIFTNSSQAHAARVLQRLGIVQHFDFVVDVVASQFLGKPDPQAYRTLFDIIQTDPIRCVLVEDKPKNLAPAHALGMTTVLVGADGDGKLPFVDYHFGQVTDAGAVLRGLVGGWELGVRS